MRQAYRPGRIERAYDWLLSDEPGAASAFAVAIIGGTFAGVVAVAVLLVELWAVLA